MASFRAALNTASGAGASTAIAKPAGTVTGDIVVVEVSAVTPGLSVVQPGGFTQLGAEQDNGTVKVSYWWKQIVAGEGASWTFTSSGAALMGGQAQTAQGGGNMTVTASTVSKAAGTTSFGAAAISTLRANACVFSFYTTQSAAVTWTPPVTATERIDASSSEANSEQVAAAGSIGTRTATSSGTTDAAWCVCSIEENGPIGAAVGLNPFGAGLMVQGGRR